MTDALATAVPGSASAGAARKFLVCLLFLITFLQGVRAGGIPIPTSLFLCAGYIVLFDPPIPRDIGAVFTFVFLTILLISVRNSLALSGGVKDFLYIGIVLESFVLTICLVDMMNHVANSDLRKMLNILVCLVVTLEVVEYFNILNFNTVFRPILIYWDATANASYGAMGDYTQRATGPFGSPTAAGFTTYFLLRSLALVSNKRWIIYLSVFPLVICGARTAMAVFIAWELIVPILSSRYRMYAIGGFLTITSLFIVSVVYFPELYENIYIVDFFIKAYNAGTLTTTDSIIYRLYGAQWAISQPLQQWFIGGMTAQQMAQFANNFYTFDSELIQRSMQYGLIGYGCFLAMNLCAGYDWKRWDWWFGLAMVAIGSITNYVATSLIIFPFLILYNVCLRRTAVIQPPSAQASGG
jgi:hypothetical protein